MAKKNETLVGDLIEITAAAPIAGAASSIAQQGIPGPIGNATGSLIGVGLLKGAAKIGKKNKGGSL